MAYNRRKRKVKKNIPEAQAHIKTSYNNSVISITDVEGNVIAWASSGTQMAAEAAAKTAMDIASVKNVEVFVTGLGQGRESSIRALQAAGLEITSINDITPVPHNGCRPPKRPRI